MQTNLLLLGINRWYSSYEMYLAIIQSWNNKPHDRIKSFIG